jgi:hypothetical protein
VRSISNGRFALGVCGMVFIPGIATALVEFISSDLHLSFFWTRFLSALTLGITISLGVWLMSRYLKTRDDNLLTERKQKNGLG